MRATGLPAPACQLGYTPTQLLELLGPDRLAQLNRSTHTRPSVVCDGHAYDPDTDTHRPTGCGPHGAVVPSSDLTAFLARERR
jgi:hypothetical protein